jgi:predicted lipoprotein with Yx(FWY)xxD motif
LRRFAKPAIVLAFVLVFSVGVGAAFAHQSATKGTVDLRSTPLGKVLVSANGHTLYLFKHDKSTKSTCSGKCAVDWPPLLTKSAKPAAGAGIKASLLGTTKRANGALQVTYHGHPLYWFFLDKAAGQTKGQGLSFFGGAWYVMNAQGAAVVKAASSGGTTTTTPPPTTTSAGGGGYGYAP